jgi:hypothetical protein
MYAYWTIEVISYISAIRVVIFVFAITCRPSLRLTQPSIQGLKAADFAWQKRPVNEAVHLYLVLLRMCKTTPPVPMLLNGSLTVWAPVHCTACTHGGYTTEFTLALIGKIRNAYKNVVVKPEGKRLLRRPRRRMEDNIKMDLNGGWRSELIHLIQDMTHWLALVNLVMNDTK